MHMHETLTLQRLLTPSKYRSTDWVVLQFGWVKNWFHHHWTCRNNQRFKYDATITSNAAPLAS